MTTDERKELDGLLVELTDLAGARKLGETSDEMVKRYESYRVARFNIIAFAERLTGDREQSHDTVRLTKAWEHLKDTLKGATKGEK